MATASTATNLSGLALRLVRDNLLSPTDAERIQAEAKIPHLILTDAADYLPPLKLLLARWRNRNLGMSTALLWRHWLAGDILAASTAQAGLLGLHEALFLETNPGPVKAAVALLGKASGDLRLPLAPVSDANLAKVKQAMVKFGLKLA